MTYKEGKEMMMRCRKHVRETLLKENETKVPKLTSEEIEEETERLAYIIFLRWCFGDWLI